MVEAPGDADEQCLRLAAGLQRLKTLYPDLHLPLPAFLLVGLQSAGKTRLLSTFARAKLGGAEMSCTGTRCPVVYEFEQKDETGFFVGRSPQIMKKVEKERVAEFVTEHMKGLEDTNSFTEQSIYVRVTGPELFSYTLVDAPGLKPGSSDADQRTNEKILAIYRIFLARDTTFPVVLANFDTTGDPERTRAPVDNLIRQAELSPEARKRSLVVVTRIDAVKADLKSDTVMDLVQHLEAKGFPKENVTLVSLKPERFEGDSDEPEEGYFEHRQLEVERRLLPCFLKRRGLKEDEFRFGIQHAQKLIVQVLGRDCQNNLEQIEQGICQELNQCIVEARELLAPYTQYNLRQLLKDHISIHAEALAGAATGDLQGRLEKNLKGLHKAYPNLIDLQCWRQVLENIQKQMRKTFAAEVARLTQEDPNIRKSVLLQPSTGRAFLQHTFHDLSLKMDEGLTGGASVKRLMSRMSVAMMCQEHRKFNREDISNFAESFGLDHVRGINVPDLIRKMVMQLKPDLQEFIWFITWCRYIYTSQAHVVCKELYHSVGLLKMYPTLLHCVNDGIVYLYESEILDMGNSALDIMKEIFEAKFNSFNPSDTTNLLQVLACTGMSQSLLELPRSIGNMEPHMFRSMPRTRGTLSGSLPADSTDFESTTSAIIPSVWQVLLWVMRNVITLLPLDPLRRQLVEGLMAELNTSKCSKAWVMFKEVMLNLGIDTMTLPVTARDLGAIEECDSSSTTSEKQECSLALDMAVSDSVKVKPLVASEISNRLGDLNELASATTRQKSEMAWKMCIDVVERHLVEPLNQVPLRIKSTLSELGDILMNSEWQAVLHDLQDGRIQDRRQALVHISEAANKLANVRRESDVGPSVALEKLIREAEDITKQMGSTKTECRTTDDFNEALSKKIKEVAGSMHEPELDLKEELAKLRRENIWLSSTLASRQRPVKESDLVQSRETIIELEKRNAKLELDMESLRRELDRKQQTLLANAEEKERHLVQFRDKIEVLRHENAEKDTEHEQTKLMAARLSKECSALQAKFFEMQSLRSEMQEQDIKQLRAVHSEECSALKAKSEQNMQRLRSEMKAEREQAKKQLEASREVHCIPQFC